MPTTTTPDQPAADPDLEPDPLDETEAWFASLPAAVAERLGELLAEPVAPPRLPTVHQAIARVLADMPAIEKAGQMAGTQSYRYRSIEAIKAALHPLLAQHGVVYAPHRIRHIWEQPYQAGSGGTWWRTRLHVRFRIYGPAGDYIEAETRGEGADNSDKTQNKAMTVAEKQMLIQVFVVDDGERDPEHDRAPEQGREEPPHPPWSRRQLQFKIVEVIAERVTHEVAQEVDGRLVPPPVAVELARTAWASIEQEEPGLVGVEVVPAARVDELIDRAVTIADLEHEGDPAADVDGASTSERLQPMSEDDETGTGELPPTLAEEFAADDAGGYG